MSSVKCLFTQQALPKSAIFTSISHTSKAGSFGGTVVAGGGGGGGGSIKSFLLFEPDLSVACLFVCTPFFDLFVAGGAVAVVVLLAGANFPDFILSSLQLSFDFEFDNSLPLLSSDSSSSALFNFLLI